jgi:hypothetical protein
MGACKNKAAYFRKLKEAIKASFILAKIFFFS